MSFNGLQQGDLAKVRALLNLGGNSSFHVFLAHLERTQTGWVEKAETGKLLIDDGSEKLDGPSSWADTTDRPLRMLRKVVEEHLRMSLSDVKGRYIQEFPNFSVSDLTDPKRFDLQWGPDESYDEYEDRVSHFGCQNSFKRLTACFRSTRLSTVITRRYRHYYDIEVQTDKR